MGDNAIQGVESWETERALCPTWVFPPTSAQSGTPVRTRLVERLHERSPLGVTLLSASAGFGKTTLVSE